MRSDSSTKEGSSERWLRHPIVNAVNFGASAITVGVVVVSAAVVLIGYVNQSLALALGVALIVSLLANIVLTHRIWLGRRRADARANEIASNAKESASEAADESWKAGFTAALAAASKSGTSAPTPSRWLPDSNDLATLRIDARDLDDVLEQAKDLAAERLNSDATLFFNELQLMPNVVFGFYATSFAAQRGAHIWVFESGPHMSQVRRAYVGQNEAGDKSMWGGDWRGDDRWRRLVAKSWQRVAPFLGKVTMSWGYPPPTEGRETELAPWYMQFTPSHAGLSDQTFSTFLTNSGDLEVFEGRAL